LGNKKKRDSRLLGIANILFQSKTSLVAKSTEIP